MTTNCTLDTMNAVPFGYGNTVKGKTVKLRFKMAKATAILSAIPAGFHQYIKVYITKDQYVFLACEAHQDSFIWKHWNNAIK